MVFVFVMCVYLVDRCFLLCDLFSGMGSFVLNCLFVCVYLRWVWWEGGVG